MVKHLFLIGCLLVPSLLQGVNFKDWMTSEEYENFKEYEASEGYEDMIEDDNSTKKQKIEKAEEAYVLEPDENGSIKFNGKSYAKYGCKDFCVYYGQDICCEDVEVLEKHIKHVESISNNEERKIIENGFTYYIADKKGITMVAFTFAEVVKGLALYEETKKDCANHLYKDLDTKKDRMCVFTKCYKFKKPSLNEVNPTEDFFKNHQRLLLDFDWDIPEVEISRESIIEVLEEWGATPVKSNYLGVNKN